MSNSGAVTLGSIADKITMSPVPDASGTAGSVSPS
jgi:hypothetical protein